MLTECSADLFGFAGARRGTATNPGDRLAQRHRHGHWLDDVLSRPGPPLAFGGKLDAFRFQRLPDLIQRGDSHPLRDATTFFAAGDPRRRDAGFPPKLGSANLNEGAAHADMFGGDDRRHCGRLMPPG